MTYRTGFYLALVALAAIVAAIFLIAQRNDPSAILKDDVLQQKRMEFISSAAALGLIADVGHRDGQPYIVATDRFLNADEEHQRTLLDAVFCYYHERRHERNSVRILDGDGRTVGEYRSGRIAISSPVGTDGAGLKL